MYGLFLGTASPFRENRTSNQDSTYVTVLLQMSTDVEPMGGKDRAGAVRADPLNTEMGMSTRSGPTVMA